MQTKISKTIHLSKFNGQTHEIIFTIQYSVNFYPSGMVVRTIENPTVFCNVRKSIVNDPQFASSSFVHQLIGDDIHSTDWIAERNSQLMADGAIHTPDPTDKIIPADHDDHDEHRDRDDDRLMDQLNDHFNTDNL